MFVSSRDFLDQIIVLFGVVHWQQSKPLGALFNLLLRKVYERDGLHRILILEMLLVAAVRWDSILLKVQFLANHLLLSRFLIREELSRQ